MEARMAKSIPTLIPDDVKARFWAKVEKRGPDDCWEWQGTRNRKGYGRFQYSHLRRTATHVAVELATCEAFPEGKLACHRCDNPPCVNPAHLFVGTMRENTIDSIKKGRAAKLPYPTDRPSHFKYKTHCKHGHEFAGENLVMLPKGWRQCRECRRLKDHRIAVRKRAARLAHQETPDAG
jgi:hypothetical protein